MLEVGRVQAPRSKKEKQQIRDSTNQQKKVHAAFGFHCVVEEWHDCEELKPKPNEKDIFVNKNWKPRTIGRSGMEQRVHIAASDVHRGGRRTPTTLKRWSKAHSGGHDMLRRVDPNGEALVWCRKCSGYARCRLEQKLMNRCWQECKDTKEKGKC